MKRVTNILHICIEYESILTYISYTNGFTYITRKEPRHGQHNRVLSKNGHDPSKVHFQTKPFSIFACKLMIKIGKKIVGSYTICTW